MTRDLTISAMDDLLSIGRFARLCGLTVGALRHYDDLDLLRPAEVDRTTNYRRYRRAQIETARSIARLRDLEVPLDEIRRILDTDDPAEQRRLLEAHRARIDARVLRLQRLHHVLGQLSTGKEPIVTAAPTDPQADLDATERRRLAVDLYNHTWALLETPSRTTLQTDELIHAAHASRYHWATVGEPANLARGEWLCARVYAVLGRGEPAVWHARRCVEIVEEHGIGDWDAAAAYEAMARALLVGGDDVAASEWIARARRACSAVVDADDREVIEQDLAGLSAPTTGETALANPGAAHRDSSATPHA